MTKEEFLQTLRAERASWEALPAGADQAWLAEPGLAGERSLQHIVPLMNAYEQGLVIWLAAADRGEALAFVDDLDRPDVHHRNALLFARHRDRILARVLGQAEQVFQRVLDLAEALPEAGLRDPGRTEGYVLPCWRQCRALWECIADDSYQHCRQHAPGVQAWLAGQAPIVAEATMQI
jgi:hypothetical protein